MENKPFHKYRSVWEDAELMERLCRIRHVALDMDGTIYMGMSLFPYTQAFLHGLKEQGIGYSFLTNNPSKSIADYLHKLDTLGIRASRDEMYTTALATIDYIKTHHPAAKRLFLLGTPSMISEFEAAGCEVVHSVEEALELTKNEDEVFVTGGGTIYKKLWDKADRLYLTVVHQECEGDTVIPSVDLEVWKEVEREVGKADEKNECDYTFINYERVK